jgi:hypothetical protein
MVIPEIKTKLPWYKWLIWRLTALCCALLLIIAALTISLINAEQVKGSCPAWRDIATAKLPKTVDPESLRIVADARYAFVHMGCGGGPLTPPDIRLYPYLKE